MPDSKPLNGDKAITLSYTLHPPSSINEAGIPAPSKASQSFLIPKTHPDHPPKEPTTSSSSSPKTTPTSIYYASASSTLRQVQASLNASLTKWKDAIGDTEKHKEDLGKVAYGQGRAARMAAGHKEGVEAPVAVGADEDSEEDGVNGEEI